MIGAWDTFEPERAPQGTPFPGVMGMQTPLTWFDTVAVAGDQDASWNGFGGALARVRAESRPVPRPLAGRARAQADAMASSGSSAYDEDGFTLRRGDSLSWLRVETLSWNRGGIGSLGDAGRHLYGFAGSRSRGAHRVEGSFAQRGAASALEDLEEQAVTGASGHLGYTHAVPHGRLHLKIRRGYDHRESFGLLLPFSRRDAQELGAEAEVEGEAKGAAWGARLTWQRSKLVRTSPGGPAEERRASAEWLALRGDQVMGGGWLSAGLGAGRHDGVDRFELAPSLGYRFGAGPFAGRLVLERVLAPVWSDLAAGQSPFLQSTWSGGLELNATHRLGSQAWVSWRMGRTRDRALLARLPLEDLWLRSGFRADPNDYDFGLLAVGAELRERFGSLGGEAFHLVRDRTAAPPLVDPRRGGRGYAELRFALFQGDLGVQLRGEVEAVGSRETDTTGWAIRTGFGGAPAPRFLDGYVGFGASAAFTLADAVVTVRVRNLQDRVRPEPWVDLRTGSEALGPGREFRLAIHWRLFD
ncbi:MAG TPA: hypothetical protein VGK93_07475 [Candidatus Eisenbacteria bacterium]